MTKMLKIIGVLLAAILIIPAFTGLSYQMIAGGNDRPLRAAPPGAMILVNGARQHIYCAGAGAPTIVLEAGGLSFSANMVMLQERLAARHRVCSYDRPGLGFSEPAQDYAITDPTPLFDLLAAAGETGPFVLLGHSLGGVMIRNAARDRDADIAGLVFVDAGPPGPYADLNPELQNYFREGEQASRLLPLLARFGVMRLSFDIGDLGPDFPSASGAIVKAFLSDPRHLAAGAAEFRRADQLARAAGRVTATRAPVLSVIGAYEHNAVDGHAAAGMAYHEELAGLSSRSGRLARYPTAEHFDFLGDAEIVDQLVEDVSAFVTSLDDGMKR